MTKRSTALTTGEYPINSTAAVMVVTAGTGSVLVEINRGDNTWQTVENFTADVVTSVEVANSQFRITPSGDATYSFGGY